MAQDDFSWPLDILTRVVKFVWPEAVFLLGANGTLSDGTFIEDDAILLWNGTKIEIIKLPEAELSSGKWPVISVSGMSYHKPESAPQKFLVCGMVQHEYSDLPDGIASVVFASNDGRTWRQVFATDIGPQADVYGLPSPVFSTANALVRDTSTSRFYMDVREILQAGNARDLVYGSADGDSWSIVSDAEISEDDYRSTFPTSYCKHNNCIDSWGQNVPDGYMKKNLAGFIMRPKEPPTIKYSAPDSIPGNSPLVELVTSEGITRYNPRVGIVQCVAGSEAGDWLAGGTGAATSGDGARWTQILDATATVFVAVAGDSV